MKPIVDVSSEVLEICGGVSTPVKDFSFKDREQLRLGVETIKPILEKAVAMISEQEWPSHAFAKYDIQIVRGDGVFTHSVPVKHPDPKYGSLAIGRKPLRIEIGADFFSTGLGYKFGQQGIFTSAQIGAGVLAHEIFHLTEVDRMSLSRIELVDNTSCFAIGVHPDFGQEWIEAVVHLAQRFPIRRPASQIGQKGKSVNVASVRHRLRSMRGSSIPPNTASVPEGK